MLLRSATSPMMLAQALMGNQQNRDSALAARLAGMLSCPAHDSTRGPLTPDSLCPSTYGFHLAVGM